MDVGKAYRIDDFILVVCEGIKVFLASVFVLDAVVESAVLCQSGMMQG